MRISEIFTSIQGEQGGIGEPSIFIRLAGCNLRCKFCDSSHTWKDGTNMSTTQILAYSILSTKHFSSNVVITGGEPLCQQKELIQLVKHLHSLGLQVTIETNGTIAPDKVLLNLVDRWNVSPKKKHIDKRILNKFRKAKHSVQLKFVVRTIEDVNWVVHTCNLIQVSHEEVYLMPECVDRHEYLERAREVIEWCLRYQFNFCPREHIVIWDGKRGV